jgi:hypothetical protein
VPTASQKSNLGDLKRADKARLIEHLTRTRSPMTAIKGAQLQF